MALNLPWLNPASLEFPDPAGALTEPNGLLAAGGDLSTERLLAAYTRGIFPWYNDGEPILWWSPDPRTVLFPGQIHISRSLQRTIAKKSFTFSFNQAFEQVIEACRQPRLKQQGTWITNEMKQAYIRLHRQGYAQSMECWQDNALAGGIYGVVLGKCFFGESMFSRVPNASRVTMVELDKHLQKNDFKLLDCQVSSTHLRSMGAVEIPRYQFLQLLAANTDN